VRVAVADLTTVQRWYDGVLGNRSTHITGENLQAKGIHYTIGPHTIDFLMAMEPQSPLINWLRTFGPSPYAATLRRSATGPSALEVKLTHGANLSFVS
jgi:hypothetical protein